MEDDKPFWLSARFWGGLIAFLGLILPQFGIGTADDWSKLGESWMGIVNAVLQFGGLAIAFVGGMRAKKQVAFRLRR